MHGVRVYSITASQSADFVGIVEGIEAPEVPSFDGAIAEALEAAEGGALGSALAGVPFA